MKSQRAARISSIWLRPDDFFLNFFIFFKKLQTTHKKTRQNQMQEKNKMKIKNQDKVNEIKRKLAKIRQFRNRCYVCHVSWNKRGMTFHHKQYVSSEKNHSDFQSGYTGMLQYYQYVTPIIKKNPKRFAYLCNPHHQTITKLLQFNVDKQDRIFRLVKESRQ